MSKTKINNSKWREASGRLQIMSELHAKLKSYCNARGLKMYAFVSKAIENAMDERQKYYPAYPSQSESDIVKFNRINGLEEPDQSPARGFNSLNNSRNTDEGEKD